MLLTLSRIVFWGCAVMAALILAGAGYAHITQANALFTAMIAAFAGIVLLGGCLVRFLLIRMMRSLTTRVERD